MAGYKQGKTDDEIYNALADKFVEMMEGGRLKWESGYDEEKCAILFGIPQNGDTGKPYTNKYNKLFLSFVMMDKETSDPRFYTSFHMSRKNEVNRSKIAQLKEAGKEVPEELYWQYSMRKGAKGIGLISYFPERDDQGNVVLDDDGNPKIRRKTFTVFHASDFARREFHRDAQGKPILDEHGKATYTDHPIEAFNEGEKVQLYTHEEINEIAEGILKNSGAVIKHGGATPCYIPSKDEIHLVPKELYPKLESYYATALHELGHWTGHASRLNRNMTASFGTPSYAKEELRAELASAFLSQELGIMMNPTNHTAYLQSWIKLIKDDKSEFKKALDDAKQIAAYIKQYLPEKTLEQERVSDAGLRVFEATNGQRVDQAIHVIVHRQKEDALLPNFKAHYEKSMEGTYHRESVTLDAIYENMQHPSYGVEKIKPGDIIQLDEKMYRVSDVGFEEVQLKRFGKELIIKPISEERQMKILEQSVARVGKETMEAYQEQFRRIKTYEYMDNLIDAQDAKSDAKAVIYAAGFERRVFENSLSSMRATDQKGWQDADRDFAKTALKEGKTEAVALADIINQASPYAVVAKDMEYGMKRVREAQAEIRKEQTAAEPVVAKEATR